MPFPGAGKTALRHERLLQIGREDLSLARLAEAHWDAVAILEEAGRKPAAHAIYGVWASEIPGASLQFCARDSSITGSKMFCTGAQLIDRALVTVGAPEPLLFEIDLNQRSGSIHYDDSAWKTTAFADTHTSTTLFNSVPASPDNVIGDKGWYLRRPGFWHGACGPAACWAGGAVGLIDYAQRQIREEPHALAHFGAMQATAWALHAYLAVAGDEIDAVPCNLRLAHTRALAVRHLVEQACTDTLRRLPRAFGPRPLAMDACVARRYQELDLYLRQSHAERDLEALGREFLSTN
jgi:alkylation response protein AidB-like acyl-CoA dehydrogenase